MGCVGDLNYTRGISQHVVSGPQLQKLLHVLHVPGQESIHGCKRPVTLVPFRVLV